MYVMLEWQLPARERELPESLRGTEYVGNHCAVKLEHLVGRLESLVCSFVPPTPNHSVKSNSNMFDIRVLVLSFLVVPSHSPNVNSSSFFPAISVIIVL